MSFNWEGILGSGRIQDSYEDLVHRAGVAQGTWEDAYRPRCEYIYDDDELNRAKPELLYKDGEKINDDFFVEEVKQCQAADGCTYLELTLYNTYDNVSLMAVLWNPDRALTEEYVGYPLTVQGSIEFHGEEPRLMIESCQMLTAEEMREFYSDEIHD